MQTIKKLIIKTPQGTSGVLSKDGRFSFRYENQNDASREISLTMPLRFNDYASTNLHPVFESCRPEGFLLERLTKRLLKFGKVEINTTRVSQPVQKRIPLHDGGKRSGD